MVSWIAKWDWVVIANICEAWEVCECKDASIWDASETRRVTVVYTWEDDTSVFK